jgi:hypothetical protein
MSADLLVDHQQQRRCHIDRPLSIIILAGRTGGGSPT